MSDASQEAALQAVSFRVGAEEFAVDILLVQEINRVMPAAQVPHAERWVAGVANLRGRVVPVLDLRLMLGAPARELDANSRVMILAVDGRTVGFVVDAVLEVARVPKSQVDPAPSGSRTAHCLDGVARLEGRLVALLNPQKLLARYGLGLPEAAAA